VPKAPAVEPTTPAASASKESATSSSTPADSQKAQKKEKKEKKKEVATEAGGSKDAGGKKGGKVPQPEDAEPVPSMIDLRVGHIIDGRVSPFLFVH
jgi:aminoacyl tRNA synthase complex-interacting multifunctional protein 1